MSVLPFLNPAFYRYLSSLEYHALGACLDHTRPSLICTHSMHSLTTEILLVVQCRLLLQVPHYFHSGHWVKCLFKVDSFNLCISFTYQSIFVPCNLSIFIQFIPENPFFVDHILIFWYWNQFPSVIFLYFIQFLIHDLIPKSILVGFFKTVWFNYR
jgi:hypothetical protein